MSTLESARVALEEIDALEVAMTLDLESRRHSHRGLLAQEHRIAAGLRAVSQRAKKAKETVDDPQGTAPAPRA
jgi:hypothetical protein